MGWSGSRKWSPAGTSGTVTPATQGATEPNVTPLAKNGVLAEISYVFSNTCCLNFTNEAWLGLAPRLQLFEM